MTSLAGRTALITGGGSGLGAAIAATLHGAGAEVVRVGRDEAKLSSVAGALGDRARWETCDVGDPSSVDELRARLTDVDVSILVNNAGVAGPVADLVDISVAEWDDVFDINVRGIFLLCRAFLPAMFERGTGDVINIASVSGKRPLIHRTPYCASKMAVIGLTSTLAFEAGPKGVSVNTLSPGPVAGARMKRNFRLEAERSGGSPADAEAVFVHAGTVGPLVAEV